MYECNKKLRLDKSKNYYLLKIMFKFKLIGILIKMIWKTFNLYCINAYKNATKKKLVNNLNYALMN